MSRNDKNQPRHVVRRIQPGRQQASQPSPPPRQPAKVSPAGGAAHGVASSAHSAVLERGHPVPATYIKVAILLAGITAVELAVFYIESLRPILTPLLIALSASKFALVVAFYMHLRFDSKVFRYVFFLGLFVAISILIAIVAIYGDRGSVGSA